MISVYLLPNCYFCICKKTSNYEQKHTFYRTADTGTALNFLEKEKIIKIGRENGGERYVK